MNRVVTCLLLVLGGIWGLSWPEYARAELAAAAVETGKEFMRPDYEIAAYYFPNYHPDARNARWHGPGWTEWELVKAAKPRFEAHEQPKVPAWGYEDESDPRVMAKKIEAAGHGITAFIFDWYWYEDGPFLHKALEGGFLCAENVDKLKFAVMWANHDWLDIHPAPHNTPYRALVTGAVSVRAFREAADHVIKTYFSHPSYWRAGRGLYFSIYDLRALLKGLGGLENARRELEQFRDRTRSAGLGEINLNAVVWGETALLEEERIADINELLEQLGFDSVSSYTWVHHEPLSSFPASSYAALREASVRGFDVFAARYRLPYYPNVTMGWDPSPRTVQSDVYENLGYPFTPILVGNSPLEFKKALEGAKSFLDRGGNRPKILTINAWNEWTEGSYLEPDTVHGAAYLEAVREVFSPKP